MILAGDTGGTSTRLGLFEIRGGALKVRASAVFPSRDHASLDEIVSKFAAAALEPIGHACFGVPGPVERGRVVTTNLPWVVEAKALETVLDGAAVWLINDLEANAYGIEALDPGDLARIAPGRPRPEGNAAVISAGTGLGEAGLAWDGRRHHPFATEGGHADFAPVDGLQIELLRFLMKEFGHVSVERVCSGPGLHNIYRFLRDTDRAEEPPWLREAIEGHDPAAVISETALAGRSELCVRALDLMVSIYGAEAANLALKIMARGGVYLGGGIPPRILPRLRAPIFLEAFLAKGRLRPLLEEMPIRVILNDQAALLGAAWCAAHRGGLL
jgi:glucokinase